MKTILQKWGNSLGIRIPKHMALGISVKEGSEITITSAPGKIVIEPAKKVYRLSDLLKGINETNLHEEIDSGTPKGREVW